MQNGVLCLQGVLDPQECALWRATYDEYERLGSQRDYSGNVVVHYQDIADIRRRLMLARASLKAVGLVKEWTGELHHVESLFVACQPPGSIIEPHYDNVKIDGVTPNHTPKRSYTVLIYLSEDFDGGEITFPRQRLALKPKIGMLVGFPSGAPYLHYVKPIRGAKRYTMPVWMTQTPANIMKFKE